jgi:hypothetical protein
VPDVSRRLACLPRPHSLTALRNLHHQAATYHRPPHEIAGVALDDPLVAYVFDQAILMAGTNYPDPKKKKAR